jgi:glutathione synthase/RimK-type ligase-like ATP-grasp enzyme
MTDTHKPGSAELLYAAAEEKGLSPVWLVRGQVLAIATTDGDRYLYDAKDSLNSQLSSTLTQDKLATRRILERNNLPSIPSIRPANQGEAEAFIAKHHTIIVKPLKGSNCHDVHIVNATEQLVLFNIKNYILEQYVSGREFRYLILNGKVIGVHESEYGGSVSETRSLKRISYPDSQWSPVLIALALKVAAVFKLHYAAIDFLIAPDGHASILEVNSSPGMKWFHAPTTGPEINVAGMFLEAVLGNRAPNREAHGMAV